MREPWTRKETYGCISFFNSPLQVLFRGYIFSALWGWFVVPTFGLAPLRWIAGCGLYLIWESTRWYSTPTVVETEAKTSVDYRNHLLFSWALPGATLFFGWCLRGFM